MGRYTLTHRHRYGQQDTSIEVSILTGASGDKVAWVMVADPSGSFAGFMAAPEDMRAFFTWAIEQIDRGES